jgi:hypothetical protein
MYSNNLTLDYLIFGTFLSDNYGSYSIYKLTKDKLYVDKREVWHSQRHMAKGYTFHGDELPHHQFELVKKLLNNCPATLLDKQLKSFYTTGNKNEDKLVVEISNERFTKSITIDSYEVETEKLPNDLRNFRVLVERAIKILERPQRTVSISH